MTNFNYSWNNNNNGLVFNILVTAIAFGMILYYNLTERTNGWVAAYKSINIVNLWLSIIYIIGNLASNFYGIQIILILITFTIALLITRIKILAGSGSKAIAALMHIVGIMWLFTFNLGEYSEFFGMMMLNSAAQTAALFALNDVINIYSAGGKKPQLKIVFLSGYFLIILTQGMMVQGGASFNNALISIIYAVTAFAWIILGFRLNNKPVRKFGLQLTIASVAKLLVIDTLALSVEMRIISYISLGLILMLISFVYQKLSRESEE
jgi:uncharacterized membrane protein